MSVKLYLDSAQGCGMSEYHFQDEYPSAVLQGYMSRDEFHKVIAHVNGIARGDSVGTCCTVTLIFTLGLFAPCYLSHSASQAKKFQTEIAVYLEQQNASTFKDRDIMWSFNHEGHGDGACAFAFNSNNRKYWIQIDLLKK